MKIKKSGEDYLEAIYNLSRVDENVHSVEIAKLLNVTKPSINKALNKLSEQEYIKKEKYGTVTLTEKGKVLAQEVLKKHKAIRKLLIEVLNVSSEIAEVDACKIEHCLSDETTNRLFEFLDKKK